jgi:hypothetical protein
VRRASKWLLPLITQMTLLVRLVSPQLSSMVSLELAPGSHTPGFTHGGRLVKPELTKQINADCCYWCASHLRSQAAATERSLQLLNLY